MGEPKVAVAAEVRGGKLHSSTLELLGKARELADARRGEVWCLVLCGKLEDDLSKAFRSGADGVMLVEHPSLSWFDHEVASRVCAKLLSDFDVVLAPATTAWRTALPAVAALLRTGLTADCTGLEIEPETGLLLQTRPAIGGNVMATIRTPRHRPQMATVRPKTFPVPKGVYREDGAVVRPSLPEEIFESRLKLVDLVPSPEGKSIQEADVVIAGGKGVGGAQGFQVLEELASLLGGGVGASRGAVEMRWIDHSHQVGLSGKVVSPKLYLAVGISGAVQHLAGMQSSEVIVSVNKDPQAPIFQVSDVAICADLNEFLPRLIQKIRAARGGGGDR